MTAASTVAGVSPAPPPPDWATVRAVLALAALDPLLPALGVVREGEALRRIMRRRYAPTAGEALGEEALAADHAGAVEDVRAAFGGDAVARLDAWARTRFTGLHADQPALSGWIEAFRAWAFARDLPDALRPPAGAHAMIFEAAAAYRTARADARAAGRAALDARLDDVDLGIMAGERWLGGEHPVVSLGFMAGAQAFMQAWHRLVEPLAAQDKALLHGLAEKVLAWRGIEDAAFPLLVVRAVPTCL